MTWLVGRRTWIATRLTIQLAKDIRGVKSARGRSDARHNRQGEKCCKKDTHDYLSFEKRAVSTNRTAPSVADDSALAILP
jgi:hypothetical protein